jgi:hypothetical protein
MKDGCLTPEELALAQGSEPNEAQRRHIEECHRCRALTSSYELFLQDGGLPEGADAESAAKLLGDFLEREIATDQEKVGILPRRSRGFRPGPAILAAAAVLVAVVGWSVAQQRGGGDPSVVILRNEAAAYALQLETPEIQDDNRFLFRWNAVKNADLYDLVILDGQQAEALRVGAGTENSYLADPEAFEVLKDRPTPWFVRVVALLEGDEIERSLPRLLPAEFLD